MSFLYSKLLQPHRSDPAYDDPTFRFPLFRLIIESQMSRYPAQVSSAQLLLPTWQQALKEDAREQFSEIAVIEWLAVFIIDYPIGRDHSFHKRSTHLKVCELRVNQQPISKKNCCRGLDNHFSLESDSPGQYTNRFPGELHPRN